MDTACIPITGNHLLRYGAPSRYQREVLNARGEIAALAAIDRLRWNRRVPLGGWTRYWGGIEVETPEL